jgi:hypothetical protein
MKNYITVFAVPVTSSIFGPTAIGGVTADQAQILTDLFLAGDPAATQDGPPTRFYWLLNKRVVSELFVSQTASFDPFNNPQFTQDTETAKDYSIETVLPNLGSWGGTDDSDPQQVKAAAVAEEIKKAAKQDLSGSGNLINNFINLMNQLIASFTKKHDTRTVGILKFLLLRFLNGQESITDILTTLRKMFIV